MALFKKTTLTSAIVMAMAGVTSFAVTGDDKQSSDMSMMDNMHSTMSDMMSNSFFADGKFMLGFKNYYRNTKDKDGTGDPRVADPVKMTQHAWTQAVMADMQSGWFMNWVGADLSFYYNQKLDKSYHGEKLDGTGGRATMNRSLAGLLPVDQSEQKATSYGKIGYDVRVNLMDYGVIKYGRMKYDTPLFTGESEFATPSLQEGFYGDFHWKDFKGYAGYVTKYNYSAGAGFHDYSVMDGDKVKKRGLLLYGAEYTADQLTADGDQLKLRAQQTHQRDFEKNSYLDAAYKLPAMQMGAFTVGAQYGHTREVGLSKKDNAGTDTKSSLRWGGAMIAWQMDRMNAGLSHVRVGSKADLHESTARLHSSIKDKEVVVSNGFAGYSAGMVDDFAKAGTCSTRFDAGYDFSDWLQGFKVKASYIWGKVDYRDQRDHRVSEFDVGAHYDIPFVKNLSAALEYGYYKDKYRGSTDQKTKHHHNKDLRFMVNYAVTL